MEIIIRKAVSLDNSEIAKLLITWLEESDITYPGYCEYSPYWLGDFIYNHLVYVAQMDGRIIGTIGLKVGYFPWNNEQRNIFCEFLMVAKDERNNIAAKLLIDKAKEIAQTVELPIHLGIMSGSKAYVKDRFLEMNGFTYAGGNFVG